MVAEIKYAKSGAVNIANQVIGDASLDLVIVPGWVSNIPTFHRSNCERSELSSGTA